MNKKVLSYLRSHAVLWLVLTILILVVVLLVVIRCAVKGPLFSASVGSDKNIELTAEEVKSIKNIGQWEFLSIETEELVDTLDEHWYGNRELVRIYRGKLRLGFDLSKAGNDWFSVRGDTASLRLPSIGLLDENFIDEARTETFYQKGSWSATVNDILYQQACRKMKQRGLTAAHLAEARNNAIEQLTTFFRNFGFSTIIVDGQQTDVPL